MTRSVEELFPERPAARLVDGKHLQCDFSSRTAAGHTSAQFSVLSLLQKGLPVLWPMSDSDDVSEISEMFSFLVEATQQPTLFDVVQARDDITDGST